MPDYQIIQGARGYYSKAVATTEAEPVLIGGSQNMFIGSADTPGGKVYFIYTRGGYSLFGSESATLEPVDSQFVWRNNRGDERFLRKTDTNLQFYFNSTYGWLDLLTTLDDDFPARFDTIWNTTELIDELLFVNHSSTLYSWTGAIGTLPNGDADVAAGTITIAEVVAEEGFLTAGTRSIMVLDSGGTWRTTVYTGQSGSQFTVSTDLSAFTFAAGAPVVQVVRENANKPASGFTNDTIRVIENQAFVGSHSSRRLYISQNDDYTDYSFSSPRVPGEGALLTLDDVTTGLEISQGQDGNDSLIIFSGRNRIYRTDFVITQGDSADREIVKVHPIPIAPRQGAISQELIARTKNAVVFINGDNELVELGSVENVNTLQYTPISDPIKPDFDLATFTNGHVFFKGNFLYVSAPTDGKVYVFDLVNRWWNTPMVLPVRQFSDYAGDLYGHSSTNKETYKLFDGVNDNSNPIAFKAHFAYRNFGSREAYKNFDRYFVEFFMTANTTISHQIYYEYLGARTIKTYQYNGTDTDFILVPNDNASLGINSLGINPLGATLVSPENLLKYRRIKKITATNFFETQARYESDSEDSQWYIIAQGPNASVSKNFPVKITS